jgi:hypothetical protein
VLKICEMLSGKDRQQDDWFCYGASKTGDLSLSDYTRYLD